MALTIQNLNITGLTFGDGVSGRSRVRVATTTAGTLATSFENGDTIDGIVLATNDRILIKDQASADENGIYVVQATGAPVRASDLEVGASANSVGAWVSAGTANAGTAWVCTSAVGSDVVGTDNLTFVQYDVASTLSVPRGGTGLASLTSGNVLVGNGTSAVSVTKAAPTGDFVGTSDSQTLTNKTLTTPVISTISNTGTITLPTATTTLVGRDTTDTLTNKTFGDDLDMGSNKIVNVATPTADGDVAIKSYVDGVASGLDVKDSVVVATTVDLDSNASISGVITYNATGGASGRGQITATLAVSDTFTVDGVSFGAAEDGSRLLIKDQSTGAQNGIWTTTVSGTSLTLDRATDFDEDSEVSSGAFTFVEEGTVNASSGWVLTTPDPITIGGGSGTALTFAQFSGAGQITAGDGLTKTGNTLDVDLKTNGGLVIETNQIAVDLSATSITGTLAVADGGTGATTLTSGNVLVGNGTGTVSTTKAAPTGDFVGTTDTQTLTNKTLTSPAIGTSILDTNGNELFLLTATGSAVNEFTVANAATGTGPTISTTGGDADIPLNLQAKGTGAYNFLGTATKASEIRLYEDTDNGTNYVGLDVPATIASDITFTLPATDGSSGDVLTTNGAGILSFAAGGTARATYTLAFTQITVSATTYTTVAYFAWDDSRYSSYTNGAMIYEVVIVDRNLDIRLRDTTNAATVVEETGVSASAFRTITGFTNPSADGRLELQVRKSANGGTNPSIFGVQLEWNI